MKKMITIDVGRFPHRDAVVEVLSALARMARREMQGDIYGPPLEGAAFSLGDILERIDDGNPAELYRLTLRAVPPIELIGFAAALNRVAIAATKSSVSLNPAEDGLFSALVAELQMHRHLVGWKARIMDRVDKIPVNGPVTGAVAFTLSQVGRMGGIMSTILFWIVVAGSTVLLMRAIWACLTSRLSMADLIRDPLSAALGTYPRPIVTPAAALPAVVAAAVAPLVPAPIAPVVPAGAPVVAPPVPAVVVPPALPAPVVPPKGGTGHGGGQGASAPGGIVLSAARVDGMLDCPPANQRSPAVGLERQMNLVLGWGSAVIAIGAVWQLITIGLESLKGTLDSSQMIDAYWAIIVMVVWRFLFPLLDRNDSRSWTVAREQLDRSQNELLPGAWRDRGGYRQIAVTVNMVVMFAAVGLQLQYAAIGTGSVAVVATATNVAVPAISKIGGLGWWLPTLAFLTFGSVELLGNKWPHLLGTASSRLDLRRLGLAMVGLIILTAALVVANFVSQTGTAAAYHQMGEAVGIPLDPEQKRCHTAREEVDVLLKRYRFGDRALTGLGTWPAVCESSAPPPTPDCWTRQLVVLEKGVLAPFATATSEERGRANFGGYCDQHPQEKACTCK